MYRRCRLEKEKSHKIRLIPDGDAKLGAIIDGWKITVVGFQTNVKYRVYIPTAGSGSRLGARMTYFNKCLIRVGDKAVISHTIDAFPKETEFVIALGYKGNIVRQYLEITYPERNFIFVEIDKYSEPGAGPGYAIKKCEEYLQCPFYYVSCDAIIDWKNRLHFQSDWAGWSDIDEHEIKDYCTLDIKNDWGDCTITGYHNKSESGTTNAFVGVAFINSHQEFWKRMNLEVVSEEEEIQVSPAILSIPNISAWFVEWWDTGSEDGIRRARTNFQGLQNLDKADEEIYFVNGAAVKYFHSDSAIKGRVARTQLLADAVPRLLGSTRNFYKYEFLDGEDLSTVKNQHEVITPLLYFSKTHLWAEIKLSDVEKAIFKDACLDFYYQKTLARLNKFYEKANIVDKEDVINGQVVPKVDELFSKVDWGWITNGLACVGHGDLNLSNILVLADNSFKLIDFRQDFGGLVDKFDAYYDFAKIYCSFLLPRQLANDGHFSFQSTNVVETNIVIPENFQTAREIFEKWTVDQGYDLRKVKILTAIVFLNMAPLHFDPLDKYLFYFAKKNLYDLLNV